jgi:hypothetical protein
MSQEQKQLSFKHKLSFEDFREKLLNGETDLSGAIGQIVDGICEEIGVPVMEPTNPELCSEFNRELYWELEDLVEGWLSSRFGSVLEVPYE